MLALRPGRIGRLDLANRLVRAATSETAATAEGMATDALVAIYRALGRGGAGLVISGHLFVETRGQYAPLQTGIHDDACLPGLSRLTQAVHEGGGRIFAELAHAGSQSVVPGNAPVSPSPVPNAIFGVAPQALDAAGVAAVVAAFGRAAARAMAAGFDGIHIHGGNGYLISQFASPLTNRRADDWAEGGRFLAAVYDAVRAEVGAAVPVTARIGMADVPAGGLDLAASVARVQALQARGLDGVEPVYNIMQSYTDNIRPYAGVRLGHALSQAALGAVGRPYVAEAYYRPFARALKAAAPGLPVILVGGLRSTAVMEEVLGSGDADFLAMARPMVREPDLPRQIAAGRRGTVDCVSCNMCLMHEGKRALQCWRKTPSRMLRHAWLHYVADRRAPGN